MTPEPLQFDSITDVSSEARGRVVVSGSHGGLYPAAVALSAGVRAAIFNDAGQGYQLAGIVGALALDEAGMAAAAVDCMSCRIGSAEDMIARGRVSAANVTAENLGVRTGQSVTEAAIRLERASLAHGHLDMPAESRQEQVLETGLRILLVDSASLVRSQDQGRIIITGSHGALIGGDPSRALKADARIGVFNDAGIGVESIGLSRLPALQSCGVAAVTVSHDSCRIGDALSALETGVISATNALAEALGARSGRALRDWLLSLAP